MFIEGIPVTSLEIIHVVYDHMKMMLLRRQPPEASSLCFLCKKRALSDDVSFVEPKHAQIEKYMSVPQTCSCPSALTPA
jgi:hypothetical protein